MTDSVTKKIISKVVVWLPVLFFAALGALLSDPLQKKSVRYPVETFGLVTRHLNLEEVRRVPDQQWFKQKNHAFTPISLAEQEVWFRINLPKTSTLADRESLVADVGFYVLKHVEFYLVENNQVIDSMVTGIDGIDEKKRDHGLYFSFHFSRDTQQDQKLYVRIASQLFMVAPIELRNEVEHNTFESLRNLLLGLLLGSSIGVLIYNVVLYSFLKRKNYIFYALFQAVVIVFAFFGNGVASALWPYFYLKFDQLVRIESQLILVAIVLPALFIESFRGVQRISSKNHKLAKFAKIGQIILLLLAPITPLPLLVIGPAFFLAVSLTKYNNSSSAHFEFRSSRYFGFAIRGVCSAGLVSLASWLGLFVGSTLADRLYVVGLIWAGLFLSMAIASRARDVHEGNQLVVTTLKNRGPKSRLNAVLRETYQGQYWRPHCGLMRYCQNYLSDLMKSRRLSINLVALLIARLVMEYYAFLVTERRFTRISMRSTHLMRQSKYSKIPLISQIKSVPMASKSKKNSRYRCGLVCTQTRLPLVIWGAIGQLISPWLAAA